MIYANKLNDVIRRFLSEMKAVHSDESLEAQERRLDRFIMELDGLVSDVNEGFRIHPDYSPATVLSLFLQIATPFPHAWDRIMLRYSDEIRPEFTLDGEKYSTLRSLYQQIKKNNYSYYFALHLISKFEDISLLSGEKKEEINKVLTYLIENRIQFNVSPDFHRKLKSERSKVRGLMLESSVIQAEKALDEVRNVLSHYGGEKEELRKEIKELQEKILHANEDTENSYRFSPFLDKTLTEKDKLTIIDYIERSISYGSLREDTNFTIRDSNGLESVKRIDVYVNKYRTILITNMEEV